jgi:hypothetical protein
MAFKYYRDAKSRVYAYESDGSQDAYIKPGLISITQAEADALRVPAPVVPSRISMAQACLALYQSNLLDDVEALIAAQGRVAQIEWERRQTVERSHPLVQLAKTELPLTEKQLDDLFTLGATL